jgi:outer membrane protein, heavy metal efflux system
MGSGLLLCGLLTGCASAPAVASRVACGTPEPPPPMAVLPCATAPVEAATELSVDALIDQVLRRSPSLAQMQAAWQATSARYSQVTSLDDPMLGATVGPASIGSRDVDFAYRLEISQKFPFPGKLRLRGESALAEASAAANEVEAMRLQLVEAARSAFADYYLAARALEVNAESLRLLRGFRQNAETRYQTGLVPQQDILQADVETGRQQERQLALERMRQVAVARLNTLLHLPPDTPLLPPPKALRPVDALPEPAVLRAEALARRPDLRALADRVAAEQAAVASAHREFCPDFEVMAAYDAFWQPAERDLRPQLAVRLNVPVRKARRSGAVAEAQARLAQRQAELARQTDEVSFEVQQAYAQVQESERAVRLYEQTILPAAEANVKAAQAAYVTGRIPFLSLLEAQRSVVGLRERYYEAVADSFRRRASLERVTGGPVALTSPSAAPGLPCDPGAVPQQPLSH